MTARLTAGFLAVVGSVEHVKSLQNTLAARLPSLPGNGELITAPGFAAFEVSFPRADGVHQPSSLIPESSQSMPLVGYLRLDSLDWSSDHTEHLRERYTRQGEQAFSGLTGDIGCCLWDVAKQRLHVVSGPLATRPVYFAEVDGGFAVASQPEPLLGLPGVCRDIDRHALIRRHMAPWKLQTQTIWPGVSRLGSGEHLRWDAETGVLKKTIWQPDWSPWRPKSTAELTERVRSTLLEAVERRRQPGQIAACELSGGLDSSSILGSFVHNRQSHDTLPSAYARVLATNDPDPLSDERQYIDQMAAHCGVEPRYCVPELAGDDLSGWEQRFARYGYFEGGVDADAEALYRRAASDGAHVLYCGAGGDEFISFQSPNFFAELFWKLRWPRLVRELQLHTQAMPRRRLASLLRSKVVGRFMPYSEPKTDSELATLFFLQPAAIQLERQRSPLPQFRYPSPSLFNLPSSKGYQQWFFEFGFNTNRAHREVPVAAAHGLDLRYPLLDAELVELALRLPADWHFRNGWPRYAMRQSMAGILPESVRWRHDKRPPMPGYSRGFLHMLVRMRDCFDEVIDPAVVGDVFDLARLRAALSEVQLPAGHGYDDEWYYGRVQGLGKVVNAFSVCWYWSWQAKQADGQ